ncbi:MAG: TetR/AcrR family transcriptional regulator [Pseudomonadota bacterium]
MADRKNQIVDAATALFIDEGLTVSTAKIAKAAGVSNGTLFNVFASKQVLIDTIYADAKQAMYAAIPNSGDVCVSRETVRENWDSYLAWARKFPKDREIIHLLLEAGLVSDRARAEVEAAGADLGSWLEKGLNQGVLRGPNVSYVAQLIFFQINLVITEDLEGRDVDLAFDMLCNSIGLTK